MAITTISLISPVCAHMGMIAGVVTTEVLVATGMLVMVGLVVMPVRKRRVVMERWLPR